MAEIVIFGAGKVADVVAAQIEHFGAFEIAAFTVDREHMPESTTFRGKPVLAFDEVDSAHPPSKTQMLVALGYHDLNAVRKSKYEQAKAKGYRLASFVSPRANVGNWLNAGDNCIILDGASVEPGTSIGNNVVIWSNVLIGHHSTVQDHCWIAGQTVFGGSTLLGAESFVGLGTIVGHEVEIGERSFIGAGSLLFKCCDPKSVFIAQGTEKFRLDSDQFLKISKLR